MSPTAAPETGRRSRRKAELGLRMLAAARALLEEHGADGVTVAQIAAAADVAEKTFYNHFGSRAELLAALARADLAALGERVERARKQPGSTRARLAGLCRELAAEPPAGADAAVLLAAGPDADGLAGLEAALAALLGDGLERGDVARAVDLEFVAGVAAASIDAARRAAAARPDYPLRVRMEQLADLIGTAIEPR